ncbi:MAG: RNHCP domain-containing protein [Patescibacteria group bacterium]
MDRKNFIKTKEDFVCENCGQRVAGTGYTNHCPKCLYSKHVDDVPGDRANACGGLMAPVGVELKQGGYVLTHKCLNCGVTKQNKTTSDDDIDQIINLSTNWHV